MSIPVHLLRSIEAIRLRPEIFYLKSPTERQFFLDQLMNWMDRMFSPDQPPISYRLAALSLSIPQQRALEIRVLRFVRSFIFATNENPEMVSNSDWFIYAYLRQIS